MSTVKNNRCPSNVAFVEAYRKALTNSPYALAVVKVEDDRFALRLADVSAQNPSAIRLVRQETDIRRQEIPPTIKAMLGLVEDSKRLGQPPVFLDEESGSGGRVWTLVNFDTLNPRLIGDERVVVPYNPA